MPEHYNLGPYSRKITTSSPEAQRWFDRGLNWCFGYHHEEAIACWKKALEYDTSCAMAYWGIAYATGPNYNMPWHLYDPKGRARALGGCRDALEAALQRTNGITPFESALIEALQARYPQRESIDDMWEWNIDYADAMRTLHKTYPTDLDCRSVFVEAIMNCTPWQMWDLNSGEPADRAGTMEAMRVLDDAFESIPGAWDHPGLLHLHVHLMEMSPFPERALRTGDRLRELAPDAGHLVHMPTHIDVLCGNYRDVLLWNQKAIEADNLALERNGAMNFYTLYRVHNFHFAIYGAMFLGQYAPALTAAEGLIATVPEDLLRVTSPPMADFLEGYLAQKQHVLVRFGKWAEIIEQPLPDDPELYTVTTAMIYYAKTVAHAALGQVEEAETAKRHFREARRNVSDKRRVHNNICQDLLNIAEEMASGEIEYRKGNFDTAFAHLRRSVELDDNLPYDEPWGWMQPSRHALGALLLEQGHVAEAETVYKADLGLDGALSRACQHPDNPWSLHGLHECLIRRGDHAGAMFVKQRLDLAGARADIPITTSCFCRTERAA